MDDDLEIIADVEASIIVNHEMKPRSTVTKPKQELLHPQVSQLRVEVEVEVEVEVVQGMLEVEEEVPGEDHRHRVWPMDEPLEASLQARKRMRSQKAVLQLFK